MQTLVRPFGASVAVLRSVAPVSASVLMASGGLNGSQPIYIQSTQSLLPLSNLALVTGQTGFAGQSPYRVFIAGVDRTSYIFKQKSQSIQISQSTNSRGTCAFTAFGWPGGGNPDNPSQYIPAGRDPVEVRRSDGSLMYGGEVDTITYSNESGHPALRSQVSCVDYGIICDRIIVGEAFTGAPFSYFADYIITVLVNKDLASKGISFVYSSNVNVILGAQIFNYISLTEVFNSIAQQTNTNWYIDQHKNLRFFDISAGTTASPETIDDSNTNLEALTVTETSVVFANRWYAKSNQNLGPALWTDTYTVTIPGWNLFILTQQGPGGSQVPQVTVNGVVKVVIPNPTTQPNNTSWDFYYTGVSVVMNWRIAPLQVGDVVKIIYPSPLPWVAVAEDLTSIAAIGLVERTVEAGDIKDKVTLQAIADEALLRGKEVPVTLQIRTRTDGHAPGELLPVNRTKLQINDNFLVTDVRSQLAGNLQWHHSITATNKAAQLQGNPNKFLGDVVKNLRMTTYNIIERLVLHLAVTTPPLTNNGLTVGVVPEITTSKKNGTLALSSIIFNSMARQGAVTTADIVVDVFQNSVSIFGTQKLTIPAGKGQTEVVFAVFASDPLYVLDGDEWTAEVLSADPLAMDGIMQLVVRG